MKRICLILLLMTSVAFANWHYLNDFSSGLQPRFSPSKTPTSAMIKLENMVIEAGAVKARKGWTLWNNAFDTLGISDMYMFWNDKRSKKQILSVVADEIYFLDDDSTSAKRIGITAPNDTLLLLLNDSIAYGFNTTWMNDILPEDGCDWRLYIYHTGGTSSFPVYRILSNKHLKLDSVNTEANFIYEENFALVPSFDTSHTIHFETWDNLCFIADGTHPVRKWTGSTFDRRHYIVDSAVISTATYGTVDGLNLVSLALSTALRNNTPNGEITEYADAHYSVIYDLAQPYPYEDQEAIMRLPIVTSDSANFITVFADQIDEENLTTLQKIYVTLPVNLGYAFATDTIFSGLIDSVVQVDTISPPPQDTLLTHFGIDSLEIDEDSIDINFSISYSSTDAYQVFFSYGSGFESRLHIKKMSTTGFRVVRRTQDNNEKQRFNWITVGTPNDADSADGETDGNDWLWQWGYTTGTAGVVTLPDSFASAPEFRAVITEVAFTPEQESRWVWNTDLDEFTVYKVIASPCGNGRHWIVVGEAYHTEDVNSADENLYIEYGTVNLPVDVATAWVYLDHSYSSYRPIICNIDTATVPGSQDSMGVETIIDAVASNRFHVKRRTNQCTKSQTMSWLVAGMLPSAPSDTNKYSLVYDADVIIDDSIFRNEDLYTAPYLFRIVEGPDADQFWWNNGAPCTLHRDLNDTLTLRVLFPTYDYDGDTITSPVSDSNYYIVEKLIQYPPAHDVSLVNTRMFFANTDVDPSRIYYSDLSNENLVSTAVFEVVGGDDGEGIVGLSRDHDTQHLYKKHNIYTMTGNNEQDIAIARRATNYGLWQDRLLTSFMDYDIGLHRTGPFTFDGSVPDWSISASVRPFFVDSLNLDGVKTACGTIMNSGTLGLIVSFPKGTATQNNTTLIYDFEHEVWSTSTFAPSSYLSLDCENGRDTLLAASADSAAIFYYGGTTDTGYVYPKEAVTAFMDFDSPERLKVVQKIELKVEADSGSYTVVSLYRNTNLSAVWTDSVQSHTAGTIVDVDFLSPSPTAEGYSFAIGVATNDADTFRVSFIGIDVEDAGEGGGL